jgi:anti-anti-sigma factor
MAEASLSCYTRRDQSELVLAFEGTLDLVTAPRATRALQEFVEQHGPDVVLDTARLDFIDSKGVGALLSGAKAARNAGGTIYLLNAATPVQKILEMCGLRSLFPPQSARPRKPTSAEATAPAESGTQRAAATASKSASAAGTTRRPTKRAA